MDGVVARLDRLLVPSRTSVYPVLVLLMWVPAWVILMGRSNKPLMIDLVARWTGGRMVTDADAAQLYDPATQAAVQDELLGGSNTFSWFVGPPFEAVTLVPVGLMPYGAAVAVWTAASAAALLLALWLIRDATPGRAWWQRMIIIALGSKAVVECVFSGQSSTFLLLAFVLTWAALRSGREYTAGIVLGLALVKPHLVVLLAFLWLLEGRWRSLAGLATTAIAWVAVGVVVLDPTTFGSWLAALGDDVYTTSVTIGQTAKNAGLSGLLTDLSALLGVPSGMLGSVLSLAVGAAAVVWVRRREPDPTMRWAMVTLCSIVFAPHAMVYDLVIVIPALALILAYWWTPALRVMLALTWVALWLLPPLGSVLGFALHPVLVVGLTLLILRQAGAPRMPPSTAGHGTSEPADPGFLRDAL